MLGLFSCATEVFVLHTWTLMRKGPKLKCKRLNLVGKHIMEMIKGVQLPSDH